MNPRHQLGRLNGQANVLQILPPKAHILGCSRIRSLSNSPWQTPTITVNNVVYNFGHATRLYPYKRTWNPCIPQEDIRDSNMQPIEHPILYPVRCWPLHVGFAPDCTNAKEETCSNCDKCSN